MNRAPALRLRRLRILERFPCLGSKDEQSVKDCIFSEYGALDAYVELVEIEDVLEHLSSTCGHRSTGITEVCDRTIGHDGWHSYSDDEGVQAEWAPMYEVSHVS